MEDKLCIHDNGKAVPLEWFAGSDVLLLGRYGLFARDDSPRNLLNLIKQ